MKILFNKLGLVMILAMITLVRIPDAKTFWRRKLIRKLAFKLKKKIDECKILAKRNPTTNEDKEDLKFFKKCIVTYYGFQTTVDNKRFVLLADFEPHFFEKELEKHFANVAKRVERFFTRNNDWETTMKIPEFKYAPSQGCPNILTIMAARYLYIVYVMRLLSDDFSFRPCKKTENQNGLRKVEKIGYQVDYHEVCHIQPPVFECNYDYEMKLLGQRSGTLTALFNQFFQEPLGRERIVPGFGKTPENVLGVSIVAFKLEYAMPETFSLASWAEWFQDKMKETDEDIKFQILEIVVAIFKMKKYYRRYFNDLISDQIYLRSEKNPTLKDIFQGWTIQLQVFKKKIKNFMTSPHYAKDIGFKRKHNIAYELVLGTIESSQIPWARGLAEDAMALIYGAEVYMTRSAKRHVIGEMEMGLIPGENGQKPKSFDARSDIYWLSMLENWADTNKQYGRECVKKRLPIRKCLLKISKYLRRMIEAMYSGGRFLMKRYMLFNIVFQHNGGNLRKVVEYWEKLRKMGITEIPKEQQLMGRTKMAKKELYAEFKPMKRPSYKKPTKNRKRPSYQQVKQRTAAATENTDLVSAGSKTERRASYLRRTYSVTRRRRTYSVTRRRRTYSVTRRRRTYSVARRRRTYSVARRRRVTYSVTRRRRTYKYRPRPRPKIIPIAPKHVFNKKQSITIFLTSFGCRVAKNLNNTRLTRDCMDLIHSKIRTFNREFFLTKVLLNQTPSSG